MQRRIIAAVAILTALYLGWWARGFVDIDSCLDAGGAWVYEGGYCRGID
jgi:hypothetical protein